MAIVPRRDLAARVRAALRANPIVTILGPRQCGKTTLGRQLTRAATTRYFDLEDPVAEVQLDEPMTTLAPLHGLVVIDEVERARRLFPVLRVLARPPARHRSVPPPGQCVARSGASHLGVARRSRVHRRGGRAAPAAPVDSGRIPARLPARTEGESMAWRENFLRTFLERDVRELGITVSARSLRRLWVMLAHYHGQVWNASEIGRSLGESHTTC